MTFNPAAETHQHVYLSADHDRLGRRTRAVVLLTAVTMVVEIAAGLWTGSMALLADGLHMATHAGALGLAAAAYAFARRHQDNPAYSFGTGKVGDLAGFSSALILAVVALGIAAESVGRLWAPGTVAYGEAAVVAVLGLAVNLVSALMLGGGHSHGPDGGHGHGAAAAHDHPHDHDHDHGHRRDGGDTNHRAALAHVLTDALTSVLAIVALGAGAVFGLKWLDPAIGILGAALILIWSVQLLRAASGVLLDRTDPDLARRAAETVAASGARLLDLHIWRVGPANHAAIVSVSGPVECEALRASLARIAGLAHVTVEVRGIS